MLILGKGASIRPRIDLRYRIGVFFTFIFGLLLVYNVSMNLMTVIDWIFGEFWSGGLGRME